jgi:hypothetical protein
MPDEPVVDTLAVALATVAEELCGSSDRDQVYDFAKKVEIDERAAARLGRMLGVALRQWAISKP